MDKEEKVKKNNKSNYEIIIGTVVFVAIIVGAIIFFLTQGSNITTGGYPDNVSDESLICTATDINYPVFTYDNSTKKEVKINILASEDKVKSISLIYSLYYNDMQSIKGSEAHNHAAMNTSFGKNNLSADSFNANYARLEDRMRMSLYVSGSDITTTALKYFFINAENVPENIATYKNIYKDNGFNCEANR